MTVPDAPEVTVVNADSWVGHAPQLALLLSRASNGDVIPDASGHPADPQRLIVLRGLPYWTQNPTALHDALNEVAADADWPGAGPDFSPGAAEKGPERLTLTVEEAAAILGISRAFAYELVRRGEIPSINLGRRVLVVRAALERMLQVGDPPPTA